MKTLYSKIVFEAKYTCKPFFLFYGFCGRMSKKLVLTILLYSGLSNYVKLMSFLRIYGHFKYAYVELEVLKMTKHPEDSSIKIRWRISGITGYGLLFKMIQFQVWRPREMIEQHKSVYV